MTAGSHTAIPPILYPIQMKWKTNKKPSPTASVNERIDSDPYSVSPASAITGRPISFASASSLAQAAFISRKSPLASRTFPQESIRRFASSSVSGEIGSNAGD